MKKIYLLLLLLLPGITSAFQCPPYSNFYQDNNRIWHLTENTPAPSGTYWGTLTQGPLAPRSDHVDTIEVMLTYGTLPVRVYCSYGIGNNIFMGVSLHVQEKQFPYPVIASNFTDEMPPECKLSPAACQFDVKTRG
jgi:hypothetical protein